MLRTKLATGLTALAATAVLGVTSSASAVTGGSLTTPDVTINVTPGNLNGWAVNGFVDWAPGDPTADGAESIFNNAASAPASTDNGAWYHHARYLGPVSNNAFYELQFDGLAGARVADWTGFQYRSYQLSAGSDHAGVLFEIDNDGDLQTSDSTYIRFQPVFLGQSTGVGTPANEWNEWGVSDTATKFLDAVNTGTVNTKAYQSIDELFLDVASKTGSAGGSPVVLSSDAVFRSVIIAGGLQGFPEVREHIDYIQFSFTATGQGEVTTRYDFGNEPGTGSTSPVPEPATASLLALGAAALIGRRRRRHA